MWCNFQIKNLKITLYCSIIFIIAFTIIYTIIARHRYKKSSISSAEKAKTETLINNLLYQSENNIAELFEQLLELKNLIKISNNHYYNHNHKKDIYLLFHNNIITQQEIIEYIKSRKSDSIDIYCINFEFNLAFENLNIEFHNIDHILKLTTDNEICFNYDVNIKNKPKYSIKSILCIVLSKSKSKSYFWLAILLLLTSIITPYNHYYSIVATFLFILSIFSRFNPFFN